MQKSEKSIAQISGKTGARQRETDLNIRVLWTKIPLNQRISYLAFLVLQITLKTYLTKHNVFSIQPLGCSCTQKELRAIGIWTSISHAQDPGTGVLQLEVLVGELSTVDGLATGAVVGSEVTALAHELRDDTVEGRALVAEALLARAERTEVLQGAIQGARKV